MAWTAEYICRPRRALREAGEMLPFGGHRHGSSWINESFRAGLSESLCFMSACVAQQDEGLHRTQEMKVASAEKSRTWIGGRTLWRRWQMSWAAGRQLSALRHMCEWECDRYLGMGWCAKRWQRHYSYFESLRYAFNDAYWELCDFGRSELSLLALAIVVRLCLHHHLVENT